MSQSTPLLGLPYLDAAQAQKHVTHNEALRMLDAVVQLGVQSRALAEPPASPEAAVRYIVPAGASGGWAGHVGQVAAWQDGAWAFFTPAPGWLAWVADEAVLVAWNDEAWVIAGGGMEGGTGGGAAGSTPLFGVNTIADEINRLAVKSDAVLLSHDDVTPGNGDMRAVMNKAAAANTAGLLFQTGYSGRAEVGLTGDDRLHVKVSADGSAWREAMVVDETGKILIGHNNAVNVGVASAQAVAMQVHGTEAGTAQVGCYRWAANIGGATFTVAKSRGATPGARAAVQQSDVLGSFQFWGDDGVNFPPGGALQVIVDGTTGPGNMPGRIAFFTTPSGSGSLVERLRITSEGHARPGHDNAYTLGGSGARWSAVWAANGTIQTSDARDKDVIDNLGFAGQMIDAVNPVLFRWKIGCNEMQQSKTETEIDDNGNIVQKIVAVPQPGMRIHAGFLAQDIKAAMDAVGADFGAWGLEDKDDSDSRQWTRPDQLIAVLWAALQETRAEVAAMKLQQTAASQFNH